jgi:hypothetical protein
MCAVGEPDAEWITVVLLAEHSGRHVHLEQPGLVVSSIRDVVRLAVADAAFAKSR